MHRCFPWRSSSRWRLFHLGLVASRINLLQTKHMGSRSAKRAWAVWLGNVPLRAAEGMSARDGWVQTRKSGTSRSSAGAHRPQSIEEKGEHRLVHPPSSVMPLNRRKQGVIDSMQLFCCDHTLRPLSGPKHWPQGGVPGGMRWGMAQDRVAAPQTRRYRPRERS